MSVYAGEGGEESAEGACESGADDAVFPCQGVVVESECGEVCVEREVADVVGGGESVVSQVERCERGEGREDGDDLEAVGSEGE